MASASQLQDSSELEAYILFGSRTVPAFLDRIITGVKFKENVRDGCMEAGIWPETEVSN